MERRIKALRYASLRGSAAPSGFKRSHHKSGAPYPPDVRDFYFLCDRLDDVHAEPGPAISEVGFFRLNELPCLRPEG